MNLSEALVVLEIGPQTTEAEASKSYRELVRVWHPDNFATKPDLLERATAKIKLINHAWEIYQNPGKGTPEKDGQTAGALAWRRFRRSAAFQTAALAVFVVLSALGLVAYLAASDFGKPELQVAKELARFSYEANRNLPSDLDDETRFTATFSGPGKRFTSVYLLKNVSKNQVGPSYFEQVRPALLFHVRSRRGQDEAMKTFEAKGVTLAFDFRDKDGNDVITIDIPPEDYAGGPGQP